VDASFSATQPGARHEFKRFKLETLLELVPLLKDAGFFPVLVGGPDEVGDAEKLRGAFPELPSLVGKCSLRETLAVLASARLAIGADTGIMHIAAAVGCPTVTVFGPTEFATRWGHLYAPHQVLQAGPAGMPTVSAQEILAAAQAAVSQASELVERSVP
jgi:ADP-heptose:LPS heptosyltransferase